MAQSKLYIIATPLGNLQDITLRAVDTFKQVDTFFAEDSRELLKLFNVLGIETGTKKVLSYASHNMKEATAKALEILEEGRDIGFVTDRGTPCISDPGALLVEKALEREIPVIPIPGVSTVTALFSVSGLPEGQFYFQGFLPTTQKQKEEIFQKIEKLGVAACIYESPKRIRETVQELKARFPFGKIFVGREITKMHESLNWFSLKDLSAEALPEMGEYAFLLVPGESTQEADWMEEVKLRAGSDKDWAKAIGQRFGVANSDIYNALQKIKKPH